MSHCPCCCPAQPPSHCHCPNTPQPIAMLQNIRQMAKQTRPGCHRKQALYFADLLERELREIFPTRCQFGAATCGQTSQQEPDEGGGIVTRR